MSPARKLLEVRVNEDFVLDAGWWEEVADDSGQIRRLVHPPERTMFEQVVDYLETSPREPGDPWTGLGEEAIAVTAVCLRWGSYLAVLLDRNKPVSTEARQKNLSRITDTEMARISIEASAALERWIDIMRTDSRRYRLLVRAASRLPMTRRTVRRDRRGFLLALLHPEIRDEVMAQVQGDWGRCKRAETEAHPTRVLANALINSCWRNGPIEDIHAGRLSTYPLTQRRVTPSEERSLIRTTAGRLATAMLVVDTLVRERGKLTWPERVLPFHLVPDLLITPSGWTLNECTREVWLPGPEPETGSRSRA